MTAVYIGSENLMIEDVMNEVNKEHENQIKIEIMSVW